MKDPRFLVALLLVLALGGFLFAEKQASNALHRELAIKNQAQQEAAERAKKELADLERQLADLKQVIGQLEARKKEAAAVDALTVGEGALAETQAGEGGKSRNEGFGKMMEKMFTDPEMKKVMRSQQSMVVKMMYADLGKELGLLPDETNQVMELLADRQMSMADKGLKMFSGEKQGEDLAEAGKEVAASREGYDQQLKAVLGEERFKKMEDYERTIGDRMQMQQYQQAFTASGMALDEQQNQGLLGILKEERLKEPVSPLEPNNKDIGAAVNAMQSEETFDKLMASQEAMNGRVLTRARTVLTPDQMTQFEAIQKQQLEMQKFGMKMGREMMKGAGNVAPPPPPTPVPVGQ